MRSRLLLFFLFLPILCSCNQLREHVKTNMVYVVADQTFLRDRIAPVSNHTAHVENGDVLEVVGHDRRFFKVKTAKGETGWIEEHLVIDQPVYDQFVQLKQQYQNAPVVATGVLRDSFYLHLTPGRETERFYLAPVNDHLQLLVRTSVPKTGPGGTPLSAPEAAPRLASKLPKTAHGKKVTAPAAEAASGVPMEDWWLARDQQGRIGWIMARRVDVDVPDEIAGYSEGQKMVGAYVLTRVYDADSSVPNKLVPIYVAVLNPYKDGLAYDFDQVRVFTWNVKKHRYETAFRQRGLEGYLPVEISQEAVEHGPPLPAFTLRVAADTAPAVTSAGSTGRPAHLDTMRFVLEGGMVRKVFPAPHQAAAPALRRNSPAHASQPHNRRSRR